MSPFRLSVVLSTVLSELAPPAQAPYVNALQYFAIGRIESLAYVFPWDFAQWQVIASFVVLPTCFYMVEESLLAFGLAVGGWSNDQLDPVYRCDPPGKCSVCCVLHGVLEGAVLTQSCGEQHRCYQCKGRRATEL